LESLPAHTMALMNQMKYRNWNNCMISQGWNLFLFFSFSPFNNVLSFCLMFCSVRLDHWTSITSLLERRRGQLNKKVCTHYKIQRLSAKAPLVL
jgi:hypothetical protein